MSGLFVRRLGPLALKVSVDRVPVCFAGSLALDMFRVVPIPGLTGLPSHRVVLALVIRFQSFCSFSSSCSDLRCQLALAVTLAPRHHRPDNARGLVGQGHRDQLLWFAGQHGNNPGIGGVRLALGGTDP